MKQSPRKYKILKSKKTRRRRTRTHRNAIKLLGAAILVLVAGLITFAMMRSCSDEHDGEIAMEHKPAWSDTLTNAASEIAALKPMDAEIERFMTRNGIKGMSLAISDHDSLIYAKGYGWADQEKGQAMTPTSMMRIASASKLITAIAIMKLVDEGKIKLSDKVLGAGGILNDSIFTNVLGDPRMRDITVDQLLMHRGGFTNRGGDPMFSVVDVVKRNGLDHAPSSEEMARIILQRKLGYEPGKGRRYSNFSYLLLSMIIEKVSGKNYYDFVTEQILTPAQAANFKPGTNYYEDRHDGEVRYYGPDTIKVEEYNGSGRMVDRIYGGNDIYGLKGAGGWVASAPDLLRVVNSADGVPGVSNVITDRSIATMTTYDKKENYSRGWAQIDDDGSWIRTGTLASSHAYIQRFPDGQCWVILTNSGNWRGASFSRDLKALVKDLRRRYSSKLPHRNLW